MTTAWKTVAEALNEILRDERNGNIDALDWWDPADAKWWSECPQIGYLDPNECADAYRVHRRAAGIYPPPTTPSKENDR